MLSIKKLDPIGVDEVSVGSISWTGNYSQWRLTNSDASSSLNGSKELFISEIDEEGADIIVYPNPIENGVNLNVCYSSEVDKDQLNIEIVTLSGQKVMTISKDLMKGINELEIETNALYQGIYIVKFSSEKGAASKKIIIN